MKKIAVVGAGIVGLATAYYLHKAGAEVVVIDRDPAGDKTSFGNAGSIAVMEVNAAAVPGVFWKVPGWMLDPLGPLSVKPAHVFKLLPWLYRFCKAARKADSLRIHQALSALNRRVYDDLLPMFQETGLLPCLHRNGALIVYESDSGFEADKPTWEMRRKAGIEAQYLSGDQARALEPDLGDKVRHGVYAPQAGYVSDPKVIVDALRHWLEQQGVSVLQGEVQHITPADPGQQQITFTSGNVIHADDVVIAAGVWSRTLARQLGDKCYVESERGYNTTIPDSGISLSREVVFAERKFVITPLSCGLRVGGAAEFGGIDNKPNFKRSAVLLTLAKMYLPGLKATRGIPWAGHRPSTPDSLPVISRSSRHRHVFYAFGHGHLGLTQSATTGRLISDMVFGKTPLLNCSPYSVNRFSEVK